MMMNHEQPNSMKKETLDLTFDTYGNECTYNWIEGDVFEHKIGRVHPTEAQKYFAEQMCLMLNNSHHHDGKWQVLWTHPQDTFYDKYTKLVRAAYPTVMVLRFFTKEDILVFEVIFDDDFDTMAEDSPLPGIESAELAWAAWNEMFNDAKHLDDQYVREARQSSAIEAKSIQLIN
jgi:hypothetical protein